MLKLIYKTTILCTAVGLVIDPLVLYGQQKPTLKQLEQQAKDKIESDRSRRKQLEQAAKERVDAELARRRQLEKEAQERFEVDRKRREQLEVEAAKVLAMTPKARGDAWVCDNGGYRKFSGGHYREQDIWNQTIHDDYRFARDQSELVSKPNKNYTFGSERIGKETTFRWSGVDSPRRLYLFSVKDLPTTESRKILSFDAEKDLAVKATGKSEGFSITAKDDQVSWTMRHLDENFSQKFQLLFKSRDYFSQSPVVYSLSWNNKEGPFIAINPRGDSLRLVDVSRRQVVYETKAPLSSYYGFGSVDGEVKSRRLLCIDNAMQLRRTFDLYFDTVNEYGERSTTMSLIAIEIIDIPFVNQLNSSNVNDEGIPSQVSNSNVPSPFQPVTVTLDAIKNAVSNLQSGNTELGVKAIKIELPKGRYRLQPVRTDSAGRDAAVVFCRCNFQQGAPPYFWIYDYVTSEKGRTRVGQTPENRQFAASAAFANAPTEIFELRQDGWLSLFIYDDNISDNAGALSLRVERMSAE